MQQLLMSDAGPAVADEDAIKSRSRAFHRGFRIRAAPPTPVRMYMREMGDGKLVTREGEIKSPSASRSRPQAHDQRSTAARGRSAGADRPASKRAKMRVERLIDGFIDPRIPEGNRRIGRPATKNCSPMKKTTKTKTAKPPLRSTTPISTSRRKPLSTLAWSKALYVKMLKALERAAARARPILSSKSHHREFVKVRFWSSKWKPCAKACAAA